MANGHVPVSSGSESARTVEVGPFRITGARFPAGGVIPPHTHERPCVCFMLGGSFELRYAGGKSRECTPGAVFIEPAEEKHCNCMGCRGARVLVLQPDLRTESYSPLVTRALTEPAHFRHGPLEGLARRLDAELAGMDSASALMLEGLAYELLGLIARERLPAFGRRPPGWLGQSEAIIRARCRDRLTVAGIAREVGVHPAHLARAFRRQFHCSIGRFIRRLRLEWAASQLMATDRSIAAIALDAGYSDQSHFTRRFRDQIGSTPHRWRRSTTARPRSLPVGASPIPGGEGSGRSGSVDGQVA